MKRIIVSTSEKFQILNITQKVEENIKELNEGVVLVFLPHATAGLMLEEDEEGLKRDIIKKLREIVPEDGKYEHNKIDDNAHAHILSGMVKQFVILPVKNGRFVRGTWQEILLLEFDGPREREVIIELIPS